MNHSIPIYECRYCLMNNDQDKMVAPCHCEGSMKYVHDNCLYKWINNNNRELRVNNTYIGLVYITTCEICHNSIRFQLVFKNSFSRGIYKLAKNTLNSLRSFFLFTLTNITIYGFFKRMKLLYHEISNHVEKRFNEIDSMSIFHYAILLIGIGSYLGDLVYYYKILLKNKRKEKVKFFERNNQQNDL